MTKYPIALLGLLLFTASLTAQKPITLEDIWLRYTFYPSSVPGFNFMDDGVSYSRLEEGRIKQYNLTTGTETGVLFDGGTSGLNNMSAYAFSTSKDRIILTTDSEPIYRRSSRAKYYVWDKKMEKLTPLGDTSKIGYATFSPDETKVAYTRDNNLYYTDLMTGEEVQITDDGETNAIINGSTDWVYEEEFSFVKAFFWSPDSKRIAFMRFDEREVPEFTMELYNDQLYPNYVTFKYPKVGEKNAKVTAHLYDLSKKSKSKIALGDYEYIPRMQWTKDANQLCVTKMNRHQNELELVLVNANDGSTRSLLKETSKYYVDVRDDLTFLEDGKHFVWTSMRDNWNHIYLYRMDGSVREQVTKGKWSVTKFYGIDEKGGRIYFQAAKDSPMVRNVYSVKWKGGKPKNLTPYDGVNDAQFSGDFSYFVNQNSTINSPATYKVYDIKGRLIRTIEDNAGLAEKQKEFGVQEVEFFDFETSEDVKLNGFMIKPKDFDENKQYPVFMTFYGGPGSQEVLDQWDAFNYWWFQMLAQQGYMVVCVDNRGTGGRGEEFQKMTYLQLGKYETIDQIETAKWLAAQPYVDGSRIGCFGWSYGGYLSSLCILKGSDVFKAAIAVAPVTNWKWYDTIYTERYMRTEKENPEGYAENSPVYFADRLKGNYLIVHGQADDNVHFQHTTEMVNQLVQRNKDFDMLFYPNNNHGIYSGQYIRLHLYKQMTEFVMNKI